MHLLKNKYISRIFIFSSIVLLTVTSYIYIKGNNASAQTIPTNSFAVDDSVNFQQNPVLTASLTNNVVVAWEFWNDVDYGSSTTNGIKMASYDYEGTKLWGDFALIPQNGTTTNTNHQIFPDGTGGAFIIWEHRTAKAATSYDLLAGRVSNTGAEGFVPQTVFSALSGADLWSADSKGSNLFVAVSQNNDMIAQRVNLSGSLLATPIDIESVDSTSWPAVTALDNSKAVFFWVDTSNTKLMSQSYTQSGASVWASKVEVQGSIFPLYLQAVNTGANDTDYSYISYRIGTDLYISGILNDGSSTLSQATISDAAGVESNQIVFSTPVKDIISVWQNSDITGLQYQKFTTALVPQLTANGESITTDEIAGDITSATSDGQNGVFSVWQEQDVDNYKYAKMNWLDWGGVERMGPIYVDNSSRGVNVENQFSIDSVYVAATGGGFYGFVAFSEINYNTGDDGNIYLKVVDFPDTMPPVTYSTVEETGTDRDCSGAGNWCIDDVDVTFVSSEPEASTYYCIGCATPDIESNAVSIESSGGTQVLRFFSEDSTGNQETVQELTFRFDTDAPVTSITPIFTPATTYLNDTFTIELTVSEAVSGIPATNGTLIRINGTGPDPYDDYGQTGSVTITKDTDDEGQYVVEYYSVDNAGNQESLNTATYFLDTKVPSGLSNFTRTSNDLVTEPIFSWEDVIPPPSTAYDPTPSSGLNEICVEIYNDSDTVVDTSSPCLSYAVSQYTSDTTLDPGLYYAKAYLTDKAANSSDIVRYPVTTGTYFTIDPNNHPDAPETTSMNPDQISNGQPGNDTTFDNITFSWFYKDPIDNDPQAEFNIKITEYGDASNTFLETDWTALSASSNSTSSITVDINSHPNLSQALELGSNYQWAVQVKDNPALGSPKTSAWSGYAEFRTNERPPEPTPVVSLSTNSSSPSVVGTSPYSIEINSVSDPDNHTPVTYQFTFGEYIGSTCTNEVNSGYSASLIYSLAATEGTLYCIKLSASDSQGLATQTPLEEYYVMFDSKPTINPGVDVELCRYNINTTTCDETLDIDTAVLSGVYDYRLWVTYHDNTTPNRISVIFDDTNPPSADNTAQVDYDDDVPGFYFYDFASPGFVELPTPLDIGDVYISGFSAWATSTTLKVEYIFNFDSEWTQTGYKIVTEVEDDGSDSGTDLRGSNVNIAGDMTVDVIAPPAPEPLSFDTSLDSIYDAAGVIYSAMDTEIYGELTEPTITSDINHYEYAIGEVDANPELDDIVAWTTLPAGAGVPPEVNITGIPTLITNTTYQLSVRSVDAVGNASIPSPDDPATTLPWTTDLEDPVISSIEDYSATKEIDKFTFDITATALSGIKNYDYWLVTDPLDPMNSILVNGTTPDASMPYTHEDIDPDLDEGTYYVAARAQSNVGNLSPQPLSNPKVTISDGFIVDTTNTIVITPIIDDYISTTEEISFTWTYVDTDGNNETPTKVEYAIGTTDNTQDTVPWTDTGYSDGIPSPFYVDYGETKFSDDPSDQPYYLFLRTYDQLENPSSDVFETFMVNTDIPDSPPEASETKDDANLADIDFSNANTSLFFTWTSPTPPVPGIKEYEYVVFKQDSDQSTTFIPVTSVESTTELIIEVPFTVVEDETYLIGIITESNSGMKSSVLLDSGTTLEFGDYNTDLNNDRITFSDGVYIDRTPVEILNIQVPDYSPFADRLSVEWDINEENAPYSAAFISIGTDFFPQANYNSIVSHVQADDIVENKHTETGLTLTDKATYYITIEAEDAAGNIDTVSSHIIRIDTSPPEVGTPPLNVIMTDPIVVFENGKYYIANTVDTMTMKWSANFSDDLENVPGESITGIAGYHYQLYDDTNSPLLPSSASPVNQYVATDDKYHNFVLSFTPNDSEYYYLKVQAENVAGLMNDPAVPPTPPNASSIPIYVDFNEPIVAFDTDSITDLFSYDSKNYVLDKTGIEINYSGDDDGSSVEKFLIQIRKGAENSDWVETTNELSYVILPANFNISFDEMQEYQIAIEAIDYFDRVSDEDVSPLFYIDTTPAPAPLLITINNGQPTYSNQNSEIPSTWVSPIETDSIPIKEFEYAFGTVQHISDPNNPYDPGSPGTPGFNDVSFENIATPWRTYSAPADTSLPMNIIFNDIYDAPLSNNVDYYLSIRALDWADGEFTYSYPSGVERISNVFTSQPIHTDFFPPTPPVVEFGSEFYDETTSIEGILTTSSHDNNNSGLAVYEFAIGTAQYPDDGYDSATSVSFDGCNVATGWQRAELDKFEPLDPDPPGASQSFRFDSCINMEHNTYYYLAIRAIDKANNVSNPPSFTEDPMLIDGTPPEFSINTKIFNDDSMASAPITLADSQHRLFTSNDSSFYIRYSATDDLTGITHYEYKITHGGEVTHKDWTFISTNSGDATLSTESSSVPDTYLNEGVQYNVHVRTFNNAGGEAELVFPIIVDKTPPFKNSTYSDFIHVDAPFSTYIDEFSFSHQLSDATAGIWDYKIAAGLNSPTDISKTNGWIPTYYLHTGGPTTTQRHVIQYLQSGDGDLVEESQDGELLYASVTARDRAFNEAIFRLTGDPPDSSQFSYDGPTLIDLTRPEDVETVTIRSGEFVSEIEDMTIEFSETNDPNSGIYKYEYSLYDLTNGEFITDHEKVTVINPIYNGSMYEFTLTDLEFTQGRFQVWIRAANNTYPFSNSTARENFSYSHWKRSNIITVDNTPPEPPSEVIFMDMDFIEYINYHNDTNTVYINFREGYDRESGISNYEVAIASSGTYAEEYIIGSWNLFEISDGKPDHTINGLSLNNTDVIYTYLRAQNSAGLWSDVAVSERSLTIDTEDPDDPLKLYEGSTNYNDDQIWGEPTDFWGDDQNVPKYGWEEGNDNIGVSHYMYKIVYADEHDSSSHDDLTTWLSLEYESDSNPKLDMEMLAYTDGLYYSIEVITVDLAGNESDKERSDSINIDRSPPTTPIVNVENNYLGDPSELNTQWQSEDRESGIFEYNIKLFDNLGIERNLRYENPADSGVIEDLTYTDREGARLIFDPPLSESNTYYIEVVAYNNAGQTSDTGVSSIIHIDTSPPVTNPSSPDEVVIDEGDVTNSSDQLIFFFDITDNQSGITNLYYALGTNPVAGDADWNKVIKGEYTVTLPSGGGDLYGFKRVNGSLQNLVLNIPSESDVDRLQEGETYYLHLVAENRARLNTGVLSSDGILLDNAAPLTILSEKVMYEADSIFNKHVDFYFTAEQVLVEIDEETHEPTYVDSDKCINPPKSDMVKFNVKFDSETTVTIPPESSSDLPNLWTVHVNGEELGNGGSNFNFGEAVSSFCVVRISREDFSERAHMVSTQAFDYAGNYDPTPVTYTWRVGDSMTMMSTNWFTQESLSSGHRQTAVPNGPNLVVVDGDGELITDQIYRLLVGPQSFATAIVSTIRNDVTQATALTEFQAPLSIRPRSLLGTAIPDLVLKKAGVAGEMLAFNLVDVEGDSLLVYDQEDRYNIDMNPESQNYDNFEFNDPDYAAGDRYLPFQLMDNTGQFLPDSTKIVMRIPNDLLRSDPIPDDTLRLNIGKGPSITQTEAHPESLGAGTEPEMYPEHYNVDPANLVDSANLYELNTQEFPEAAWDESSYEIIPGDTMVKVNTNYFINKFVDLKSLTYGMFSDDPTDDSTTNGFELTADGLFNFGLSPTDTKIAGKRLVLEVIAEVMVPKEHPQDPDVFFPLEPFKIIFNIEPNIPSMVPDPLLDSEDVTSVIIENP